MVYSTTFTFHGGYSFGPFVGPILVLIAGLSLVFFSVSGIIVFFTRTWRPSAVSYPRATPTKNRPVRVG
jgi:uncharacterized iron-regulated membrane protein